jgi:hypothetical protein
VNYEDQVAALFAKANPVPSLDLLDPVELVDIAGLVEQTKRSRVMVEVETFESAKERQGPKAGWVIGIAATVAAVMVAGSLLNREPSPAASPGDVATAFIAAASAQDREAAAELLAPEAFLGWVDMEAWEHDRAIGLSFDVQDCEVMGTVGGSTPVDCTTLVETDLTRALGLEPATGSYRVVVDESGQIVLAELNMIGLGGLPEAEDEFRTWVEANHPDDIEVMYDPDGSNHFSLESVALWDQYVDEYLASLEG